VPESLHAARMKRKLSVASFAKLKFSCYYPQRRTSPFAADSDMFALTDRQSQSLKSPKRRSG
jgi:hypothetical protein